MMISHADFGRLRLSQFLPEAGLAELEGWEFQNHIWVGEALGFSEWLRLEGDPAVLRSLSIDFAQFPKDAADSALRAIQLPVRAGMSLADLERLLGPRVSERRFVPTALSCDYFTPDPARYRVSCNVEKDGGLSYLVVMVPPIGDEV
jgi:hypothetical protein